MQNRIKLKLFKGRLDLIDLDLVRIEGSPKASDVRVLSRIFEQFCHFLLGKKMTKKISDKTPV